MRTCHRHYPGRLDGACSLVYLHRLRPSLCNSQVGSCNCFFEACSAFTHVMACTLAESPSDPLHRKLRQLRCLCCRFDCYRVERTSSRAGVAPAEVQRLSRRTFSPTTERQHSQSLFLPCRRGMAADRPCVCKRVDFRFFFGTKFYSVLVHVVSQRARVLRLRRTEQSTRD
jgi:hypothetical protein